MKYINTQELMHIWKKNYQKILFGVFFIMIAIMLLFVVGSKINVENWKHRIIEYRKLSMLIFVIIYTLKALLVILPSSPLIIFAGIFFGPIKGFLLSMIGAILSAIFAYYIGIKAGSDFIHRIFGHHAKYLNNKIDNYGIRIIAIIRASFVVPYDILSYMAGIAKMKISHFLIGTILGIGAEVFSLAYLGHNITKPHSKGFVLSIVTIILVIVIPIIYSKFFQKKPIDIQKEEEK